MDFGVAYYVRAYAHNSEGYGQRILSTPRFEIPAHSNPGVPVEPVLVASTESSITIAWEHPTMTGGALISGYELWMDSWAEGEPKLVYDGTDNPDNLQFTVQSSSSLVINAGMKYRFFVRAMNYCNAQDPNLVCFSDFSTSATFTTCFQK